MKPKGVLVPLPAPQLLHVIKRHAERLSSHVIPLARCNDADTAIKEEKKHTKLNAAQRVDNAIISVVVKSGDMPPIRGCRSGVLLFDAWRCAR